MKHILIVGPPKVGKSTLLQKTIKCIDKPIYGFKTKKEDYLSDDENGSPVYLYEIGKTKVHTKRNLLAYCKNHHIKPIEFAFDSFAPVLKRRVQKNSVLVIDELGVIEQKSKSQLFCNEVLKRLDEEDPIIAVVKDKEDPFLEAVRTHKNTTCFYVTKENREEMFCKIMEHIRSSVLL